jgi:tetratricopeptide (TPR) repeat protein
LYATQGDYAQAKAVLTRAVEICERAVGTDHPDWADAQYNLATYYLGQQDELRAQHHHQQALATWEKTIGLSNPRVIGYIEQYRKIAK